MILMKCLGLNISTIIFIILILATVPVAILLICFQTFGVKMRDRRIESVKNLYTLENNCVTLRKIIDMPKLSANEIFPLIQLILVDKDLNATYEIVSADEATKTIVAKGSYSAYYKRRARSRTGLGAYIENSIKISVKDEKCRLIMTLVSYKNDAIHVDVSSVYPISDKLKRMTIAGNRMMRDPATRVITSFEASKYFHAAVTTGNELLDTIEELSKPNNDDDW